MLSLSMTLPFLSPVPLAKVLSVDSRMLFVSLSYLTTHLSYEDARSRGDAHKFAVLLKKPFPTSSWPCRMVEYSEKDSFIAPSGNNVLESQYSVLQEMVNVLNHERHSTISSVDRQWESESKLSMGNSSVVHSTSLYNVWFYVSPRQNNDSMQL